MAQEVKKCGDDPTPGFLVHENEHWTQEHEKETQLQKKRRKERALEAAAHNGLTTEEKLNEIDPDHEQAVEDFKAARNQKVRSYLAKKIRDTKKKEKAAASIFSLCSGKKVFISTIQAAPSLVLDQHMDKLGAKYESSLLRADAFVVPDVTDPAEETLWHAFLSGGLLLSPQAFSHGEGPAVKYCCAVSIRRTVYISSGFQEEKPSLVCSYHWPHAAVVQYVETLERHAFVSSILAESATSPPTVCRACRFCHPERKQTNSVSPW